MVGDLLLLIYLCKADSTSTHIYVLAATLTDSSININRQEINGRLQHI